MLCNTAVEEKIAAKCRFSPKAHKAAASARIDKIAARSVQCRYPNRYMEVKR